MERFITVTTEELGDLLGMSQQSASLYLKHLEEDGSIERVRRHSGTGLKLTGKGIDLLMALYNELDSLFGSERTIEVKGKVSTGLGEGAYYLSQEGYISQLKEKAGIQPYRGTLNIVLDRSSSTVLELLRRGPGILINGFESDGRSFGACLCYPCMMGEREGVVMVPSRTLHDNTIEIVSEVKLREALDLKEGDPVLVRISYPADRSCICSNKQNPS